MHEKERDKPPMPTGDLNLTKVSMNKFMLALDDLICSMLMQKQIMEYMQSDYVLGDKLPTQHGCTLFFNVTYDDKDEFIRDNDFKTRQFMSPLFGAVNAPPQQYIQTQDTYTSSNHLSFGLTNEQFRKYLRFTEQMAIEKRDEAIKTLERYGIRIDKEAFNTHRVEELIKDFEEYRGSINALTNLFNKKSL